jgi:hypothetical protein
VTFSKTELKHMRHALRLAIDYQDALIDAYRTDHNKRGAHLPKVLSKDARPVAARCRREIAAFGKLLARLSSNDIVQGMPK